MSHEYDRRPAVPRARLLVAGADAERLRRLRHALVRSGRWIVGTAGSCAGLMQELIAGDFDLLLVDPELGGADQPSILRRLREVVPAGGVPRVALMRGRDPVARVEAWRLGAVDVLEPPLGSDELLVRLSAALAHARPREAGAARPGDLSGRLSCISFAEVVSLLASARRGGALTLRTGRGRGKVLFHDGAIVHADFDGKTGHDAIFALMDEEHGNFEFRNVDLAVDRVRRTVTWHATALIMEGARLIDERQRDLAQSAGAPSRP